MWKALIIDVNTMSENLTDQFRSIAEVTTSIARGDLTRKIVTNTAAGEVLELKTTINTMVDDLSVLSDEIARVTLEYGTDGKAIHFFTFSALKFTLLLGIDRTLWWPDISEASYGRRLERHEGQRQHDDGKLNRTDACGCGSDDRDRRRRLLEENFSGNKRLTVHIFSLVLFEFWCMYADLLFAIGEMLELKCTVNDMATWMSQFSSEINRVAIEHGTLGKASGFR